MTLSIIINNQLSWISHADIVNHVAIVIDKGLEGIIKAQKNVARNHIDPFSALFDATLQNISLEQWLVSEQRRQAQKTLQHALGHFHQKILSSTKGCYIPDENFVDLVNDDKKSLLKSKINTTPTREVNSPALNLRGC